MCAESAIARAGLESLIREDARFKLAGDSCRPAGLDLAIRRYSPEVVLLDLVDAAIPGHLRTSLHAAENPAFVLLVQRVTTRELRRSLQAGIRGVILRDAAPEQVTDAVAASAAGLVVVSPELLEQVVPAMAEEEDLSVPDPLTPREVEVLSLLAEGAANKEIAARLNISEHTVKFHISSLLAKLGAATRTEAVSRGYKQGLIIL